MSGLKMAPVSTNDFKTGMTILMEGSVYKVLEFLHVKPGKGSAFVRTKLKNLTAGWLLLVNHKFRQTEIHVILV